MTAERVRMELKVLFPSLPIRLTSGVIALGDNVRIDTVNTETHGPNELARLANIIRELLRSGWLPSPKPPEGTFG